MTNEATPLGHRYLLHEVIGRGAMGDYNGSVWSGPVTVPQMGPFG